MDLAIALTPPAVQLAVADTITASDNIKLALSATSLGFPVLTPRAEWTSSNKAVAIVDSTGLVQAIGLGPATIQARVNDEKAATAVTIVRRVVSVALTPTSVLGAVGDTAVLTAQALDASGLLVGGTAYAFSTTDPTVASVTRTGNQTVLVRLLKTGSATVAVTADNQTASTPVTVH